MLVFSVCELFPKHLINVCPSWRGTLFLTPTCSPSLHADMNTIIKMNLILRMHNALKNSTLLFTSRWQKTICLTSHNNILLSRMHASTYLTMNIKLGTITTLYNGLSKVRMWNTYIYFLLVAVVYKTAQFENNKSIETSINAELELN